MQIGRLHILTDYHFQKKTPHWQLAEMAIQGGADTIQFREKHVGTRHILYQAQRTAKRCRKAGVPLIVNDRLDIALAVDADGVHVGQEDLPVAVARRLLGEQAIVGASATTREQALQAEQEGASYIGFGPVFDTASKANPAPVKGLDVLASVCAAVRIPVVAIAGVTADRVPEVMAAGAFGIAVMTAVSLAADPIAATADLARAVRQSLTHRHGGGFGEQ